MTPFALGLAAATMAALAAGSPLTAATQAGHQPVPGQSAASNGARPWGAGLWPVTPATVVRGFEPHEQFGPGHRGVDLTAVPGQEVRAPITGQVLFVGDVAGRPIVVIEHADGLRTTYLPIAPTVAAGSRVEAGQRIGTLAADMHCPMRYCLHWGARLGDEYVDPLTLVGHEVVVLLPLDE